MPVELQALKDGKLIVIKASGVITHDDRNQYFEAIQSVCDNSETSICMILILAESVRIPNNVLSVTLQHPRFPFRHPNFGLGVVVVQNSFIETLAKVAIIAAQLTTLRVTSSFDSAMQKVEAFFANRVLED